MKPLYFKTFDEYEKNLELVKAEFQQDEPSWLHYWFYRYLQISPFYWAMHLNQSKSKKDQDKIDAWIASQATLPVLILHSESIKTEEEEQSEILKNFINFD